MVVRRFTLLSTFVDFENLPDSNAEHAWFDLTARRGRKIHLIKVSLWHIFLKHVVNFGTQRISLGPILIDSQDCQY